MELQEDYQSISDLDAQVIAISMDDLSHAGKAVEHLRLQFPVLHDLEGDVARRYEVYDLLNDGLAAPAIFLLDKDGKGRWEDVSKDPYDRPTPERILIELGSIRQG